MENIKVMSYQVGEYINLDDPEGIWIMLKCQRCHFTGKVKELWLVESKQNAVERLHAESIRLTQYPPYYKIFNAIRRKQWIRKNGSHQNLIVGCILKGGNIGIKIDGYENAIVSNYFSMKELTDTLKFNDGLNS